jgi:putative ABC transport system permease protein
MRVLRQTFAICLFNLRDLFTRLHLTGIGILGVAGVSLVLVGMLSMADGFRAAFRSDGAENRLILLRSGATSELSSRLTGVEVEAIREAIQAAEGPAAKISPETYFITSLVRRGGTAEVNVPVRGLSPEGMALRSGFRVVEGRMSVPGAHELLVGKRALEEYGALVLGSTLPIGRQSWRVVGVFETDGGLASSEIWGDPYLLQTAFDRGNAWQLVIAGLPRNESQFDIELQLSRDKRLNVRSLREDRYYAQQSRSLAFYIQFVGRLLSLAMGAIALFVVLSSMYAAVAARQREIAILRVMGFGAFPILCSVLEEAVFLAATGGVLGGVLAYFAFDGRQLSTLNLSGSFTQIPFAMEVTSQSLRSGVLLGIVIGVLAGIGPAIQAIRRNVATTLTSS